MKKKDSRAKKVSREDQDTFQALREQKKDSRAKKVSREDQDTFQALREQKKDSRAKKVSREDQDTFVPLHLPSGRAKKLWSIIRKLVAKTNV